MKNRIKKIVVSLLVLSVVFLFSGVTNVFAHENYIDDNLNPYSFPTKIDFDAKKTSSDDINELSIIEATPNDKVQAIVNGDFDLINKVSSATVATMRIFAINSGGGSSFNTSGHAFLSIKNVSQSSILVGGLSVGPGKTITVGTWGNKKEHTGLWYNLEGYFQKTSNAYVNAVSLRVNLSPNLLSTVSKNIKNSDSWSLLSNCSTFATKVWNSVCSTKVNAGFPNTPAATVQSIKSYSNLYSTGVSIPYFGRIYYGNPPVISSIH